jgi:hypothetical protein
LMTKERQGLSALPFFCQGYAALLDTSARGGYE